VLIGDKSSYCFAPYPNNVAVTLASGFQGGCWLVIIFTFYL